MNEMYLGYNPRKAVDLIQAIVTHYQNLGTKISADWDGVKDALRGNWVGGDELSYEKEFVKKICSLYVTSYELTKNCVQNIKVVLDNYIAVQKNNLLEGAETNTLTYDPMLDTLSNQAGEVIFNLAKKEDIITFTEGSFADSDARGLANADSKGIIQQQISTYVTSISNQVEALTDSINVKSAFFGSAGSKLETYVISVKDAVKVVSTAVKDLNDALEQLAGSHYTDLSSQMESELGQATTETASIESEVKSRWSA